MSKLLRREGASINLSARFYLVLVSLVLVSAVLLYGSETWVLTKRIEDLLTSFHNRCARMIGKTYIRKTGDDEWVYPSVAEALKKANLRPLEYYLMNRRSNFKHYATTRDFYKTGGDEPSLVQPFPTLWAQYDRLETESDLESTPDCERNLNDDFSLEFSN